MEGEIISIETAQKLRVYNRLLLERKNVIRFLRNQIELNQKHAKIYKELKDKNQLIAVSARILQAQELLKFLNEEV